MATAESGAFHDGKVFHNQDQSRNVSKSLIDVLRWRLTSRGRTPWPDRAENVHAPALPSSLAADAVAVTGINHATDLIQFQGFNVLTDPVFSERVSPVSWAGPRRARAPGLAFEALPKIDAVFVSHNHYDHMDLSTCARLWRRDRPRFVAPLGNARHLASVGIEGAVELDWWETRRLSDQADVTMVPAQHWSGRGLFDRRRALWGGFFVRRGGATAYFAGDTGFGGHFSQIRSRLGSPQVALLPIGAYEPRWFMRDQHIDPDEAVRAHVVLGAAVSLGMHFGTFALADDGIDDAPAALSAARCVHGISEEAFPALHNGMTVLTRRLA